MANNFTGILSHILTHPLENQKPSAAFGELI